MIGKTSSGRRGWSRGGAARRAARTTKCRRRAAAAGARRIRGRAACEPSGPGIRSFSYKRRTSRGQSRLCGSLASKDGIRSAERSSGPRVGGLSNDQLTPPGNEPSDSFTRFENVSWNLPRHAASRVTRAARATSRALVGARYAPCNPSRLHAPQALRYPA